MIDLQQIGFLGPVPAGDFANHRVKTRNAAAIWSTVRAAGAECLIIVGAVGNSDQFRAYTDALPAATITLVRLNATIGQLTERINLRGNGAGPRIPGDDLIGRDAAYLAHIASQASNDATRLAQNKIGDVVIDTDDLTIDEVADAIQFQIGEWPRA